MGKPFWFVLIAFGLSVGVLYGQGIKQDTVFDDNDAKYVIEHYRSVLGNQLEVYNGAAYYLMPVAYKGSPYFMEEVHVIPGSVRYNGTWYPNFSLLYDIYTDVMVSAVKDSLFVIRAEKVSDIYLAGHHFINLDAKNSYNIAPGFYDQLYDGKSQVLAKRIRTVRNSVTAQTVEVSYENEDVIYIKKGNSYYPVDGKGSVMDVFKDKKKQLNQYLNDNNIRYKNDKELSVVKLSGYYDQISN